MVIAVSENDRSRRGACPRAIRPLCDGRSEEMRDLARPEAYRSAQSYHRLALGGNA